MAARWVPLHRPDQAGSQRLGVAPVPHLRRFPLDTAGVPAEFPDDAYLVPIYPQPDAAFQRDGDLYLLMSGARYARPAGRDVDGSPELTAIGNSWVDLPAEVASKVTGSLDAEAALYLFLEGAYLKYPKDVAVQRPFELAMMPREIVRLTSGTAATLNQLLLAGGVRRCSRRRRRRSTRPRGSAPTRTSTRRPPTPPSRVGHQGRRRSGCPPARTSTSTARTASTTGRSSSTRPLLIAQALNDGPAVRGGDARWYEYVFDPTQPATHWRFLPFLAVDVDALVDGWPSGRPCSTPWARRPHARSCSPGARRRCAARSGVRGQTRGLSAARGRGAATRPRARRRPDGS